MKQSPLDVDHGLLKAQFMASCKRVSRSALAHAKKTKTLQATIEDEEEKGPDSKLSRLLKINGAIVAPSDDESG